MYFTRDGFVKTAAVIFFVLCLALLGIKECPVYSAIHNGRSIARDKTTHDLSQVTVCIDPGHPSEVSGGRVKQHGLTELAVDWQVANKLSRILQKQYHIKTVLTRNDREKLTTNRDRAEVANNANARVFIRLHCDTEPSGQKRGFTIYYPDRQGICSGTKGPPAKIISASRLAAVLIEKRMAQSLAGVLTDNGIKPETKTSIGRRQGALTGSIYSHVPVVLVEMVFLSSRDDAQFIGEEKGQEKMAQGLAQGIVDFVSK
ncbi:MAG: N-acetylmuramoyl-L-alanine amidase family protein [Candidatus Saccharibacteria bacterium]